MSTTFFRLRDELAPSAVIRVRGVCNYDLGDARHREELERWEDYWAPLRRPQDRIYMKRLHSWGNQKDWDGCVPNYGEIYHPCVLPFSTLQILTDGSRDVLRLQGSDNSIRRSLDLSGQGSAVLSFDYRRDSLESSSEYLAIELETFFGVNF